MAIQHILDDTGAPTHVVLSIEEWQGLVSANANVLESIKSNIDIPQEVQNEVLRRKDNIGKQKSYSLDEVKSHLKQFE